MSGIRERIEGVKHLNSQGNKGISEKGVKMPEGYLEQIDNVLGNSGIGASSKKEDGVINGGNDIEYFKNLKQYEI